MLASGCTALPQTRAPAPVSLSCAQLLATPPPTSDATLLAFQAYADGELARRVAHAVGDVANTTATATDTTGATFATQHGATVRVTHAANGTLVAYVRPAEVVVDSREAGRLRDSVAAALGVKAPGLATSDQSGRAGSQVAQASLRQLVSGLPVVAVEGPDGAFAGIAVDQTDGPGARLQVLAGPLYDITDAPWLTPADAEGRFAAAAACGHGGQSLVDIHRPGVARVVAGVVAYPVVAYVGPWCPGHHTPQWRVDGYADARTGLPAQGDAAAGLVGVRVC